MTRQLERDIEVVLETRTGRECVFMPSGRFAIHLAFRLLLRPGDRLLMSPLEDDTVFFGALAAGLRPVIAPVSTHDGNIRVEAVDDATWSGLAAVLTGNTYGLPDRLAELTSQCARLGIPLIEDAAHALESDVDGTPIGATGSVSVFSLSKHLNGRGGVLSLDGAVSRRDASQLQRELMIPKALPRRLRDLSRSAARTSLDALHLTRALDRIRRAVEPVRPDSWRVPLQASRLRGAVSHVGLDQFDQWMETGYPDYRMPQQARHLERTLAGLRDLQADCDQRIAGVLRLRALDAIAPAAREGTAQPLLRVPLLVENRDAVALELRRRRIKVYFVYDPPLDDYSGLEFSEPSSSPEAARWWAAHVLPIDPRDAVRVIDMLGKKQIRLTPAPPLV